MNRLLQSINEKIQLTGELKEAVQANFQKIPLGRKELLLREQQYARKLYFVEKGTIRTYYHHDGKEVTSWFYHEDQFLTSWFSFYSDKAGYEYIETLEDCTLWWIDQIKFRQLIDNYQLFERFARLLAEEQLAFIDSFSRGFMFMSAKEKYELLLAYFPDIELRVQLGYIASFLGISQETLSRIRNK